MAQNVAALVSSKICHDLINPIGAIGNGLELMSLASDQKFTDEIELIAASAECASLKLQFFRLVYGYSQTSELIAKEKVEGVLAGNQQGNRFNYVWNTVDHIERTMVRTALLLIQCLESAAPSGGKITVDQDDENWTVKLIPNGPLKIIDSLWATLNDESAHPVLTSDEVQFALAPQVAKEMGRNLTLSISDTIQITF